MIGGWINLSSTSYDLEYDTAEEVVEFLDNLLGPINRWNYVDEETDDAILELLKKRKKERERLHKELDY